MSDHRFRQWSAPFHYTALRDNFRAHAVCREYHAGLTADLRLQLRRGAAHRKAWVIHFVVFHQTGEDLWGGDRFCMVVMWGKKGAEAMNDGGCEAR